MAKKKNPAAVALGKLGGEARARRMPAAERKAQMAKALAARWAKTSPEERRAIAAKMVKARRAKAKVKAKRKPV